MKLPNSEVDDFMMRSEETVSHLREDNVRLERELFLSHEQLECAKNEIISLQQSLDRSDAIAITSRNDNQRQCRLRHLKDTAEQARTQRDESVRKMESLRKQLELAVQEIESLTRSNEEVRHLEAALEKSRIEKSDLYDELSSQRSMLDRVLAEKDALLAQVTTLNGQLDERTNRLRQAGEAKMDTTLRIVELESQIAAILRERDTSAEHNQDQPSCSGLGADQPPLKTIPIDHVAVQIENEGDRAEIERLRTELKRAEERIAEVLEVFERTVGDDQRLLPETSVSSEHDAFVWPHHFITASTPLPSLVTLLSRRLSALRHRPSRAILPYFRYAMAVYAVALHIMLIHCWFFAVCP
ncbi:hypothetical protein COOONC_07883 [Cooperia oncophora]